MTGKRRGQATTPGPEIELSAPLMDRVAPYGPNPWDVVDWWESPSLAYWRGLIDGAQLAREAYERQDDAAHRAAVRTMAGGIDQHDARRAWDAEVRQRRTDFPGLANGGVLPSADWKPDTSRLAVEAERAMKLARVYPPSRCGRCKFDPCRCAPSGPDCRCWRKAPPVGQPALPPLICTCRRWAA